MQRQFDLVTQETRRQAEKSNAAAVFQIDVMGLSTLAVLKLTEARRIDLELEERIYQLRKKDPGADVAEAVAKAEEQKAAALALVEQGYNKQRDGAFGAQEALRKYADEAADKGAQIEKALTNAFKNAEDALVNFVKTGKLDFRSLADSLISDLIRIQVKGLLGGVAGAAAGGLSSLFGSFGASYFSGNTGAATGLANALPGDSLDNLIKLTGGFGTYANGLAYVPYDGMAAILHEGERVVSKQDNAGDPRTGSSIDNSVGTINVGQGVSRGEVSAAINHALGLQEQRLRRLQRQGTFS